MLSVKWRDEAKADLLEIMGFIADEQTIMINTEYDDEELEARIARFEQALIQGLDAWTPRLVLLQTVPGIDRMGAAMLLVEVSAEKQNFGSAERLASWVGICPGCTDMPAMPERFSRVK